MKKMVSGNEALAYGAVSAGVKVVSGYPGTPSTEAIATLLKMDLPDTNVEWSVNEKVGFEVAAGAALAGQRALFTTKMSGLNVCYDSLIGIAYSGCNAGLVVYVADDPGVTAGMCEQDTRGFAVMSDMPMLEPCSVQEIYDMTQTAFDMSEAIGGPVFIRLVTNNSQSHAVIDINERKIPVEGVPLPKRDPDKFTKAGAAICMTQHQDLIDRLALAEKYIAKKEMNVLKLAKAGGVGLISVGIVNGYANEALEALANEGIDVSEITVLELVATIPYAIEKIDKVLDYCETIVVCEELEPHLEKYIYMQAYKKGVKRVIIGKEDGTYKRIGEYNSAIVAEGVCKALGKDLPEVLKEPLLDTPEKHCAARPIGFCAGCPHRGTYMGMEMGLKKLGYKKDDIMITGDIGCTILGTMPPFDILWTELAMGASIPLAQGVIYSNVPTPVVATIGDSTFFHGGIPGLVNALQHNIDITIVILDNGWTAMTGMQVNPGTEQEYQLENWKQLDIEQVAKGLGVTQLYVVDAYECNDVSDAFADALNKKGVKVILSRKECAIQAARKKVKYSPITLVEDKCTKCKKCINVTGCPAISLGKDSIVIDKGQCNDCGLCTKVCPFDALVK